MPRVHDGPRGPSVDFPSGAGGYAGTDDPHRFEGLTSLGDPLCLHCYGFSDDPRHYLPYHWQYAEDELCRRYENGKDWQWATNQWQWERASTLILR